LRRFLSVRVMVDIVGEGWPVDRGGDWVVEIRMEVEVAD